MTNVNPGYNEPFCTGANGSLYSGIHCKGRDFTRIRQGGAHREGSLYPGVCCVGDSFFSGFTVNRTAAPNILFAKPLFTLAMMHVVRMDACMGELQILFVLTYLSLAPIPNA